MDWYVLVSQCDSTGVHVPNRLSAMVGTVVPCIVFSAIMRNIRRMRCASDTGLLYGKFIANGVDTAFDILLRQKCVTANVKIYRGVIVWMLTWNQTIAL